MSNKKIFRGPFSRALKASFGHALVGFIMAVACAFSIFLDANLQYFTIDNQFILLFGIGYFFFDFPLLRHWYHRVTINEKGTLGFGKASLSADDIDLAGTEKKFYDRTVLTNHIKAPTRYWVRGVRPSICLKSFSTISPFKQYSNQ